MIDMIDRSAREDGRIGGPSESHGVNCERKNVSDPQSETHVFAAMSATLSVRVIGNEGGGSPGIREKRMRAYVRARCDTFGANVTPDTKRNL